MSKQGLKGLMMLYLLLLSHSLLYAQYEQVTDTVVVEAPAVDTSYAMDDADAEEEEYVMDTLLSSTAIFYPNDSLRRLRKDKQLATNLRLDSLLKRWQEEQKEEQPKEVNTKALFTFIDFLRLLLWFLVIGGVLFLIYRLFLSEKGLFTASVKKKQVMEEEEPTDEGGWALKVKEAEQQGNYRLAVRYLYLQVLALIAEKGWLQLSADKTNYQYVRELTNKAIRNEFARITLHYEYAWYGNFEVEEQVYRVIKNEYSSFQTKIRN